ncbi:hypothetical protein MGN70_003823 [Eutypa lata]|nr:hypothetical protein MGN70_003823 [Eutypa lata]
MPPLGYKYNPGSYKTRNKRGPKPFPGTRRKRCDLRVPPPQPIVRPKTTYNKKRKTDVLMYLIHHRLADARGFDQRDHYFPITRMRQGMAPLSMEEAKQRREYWDKGAVVYRPPTLRDAENFWKIPHSTITHWWKKREKYLPASELERVKDYNPLSGMSMGPLPLPPSSSTPDDPQQASGQLEATIPPAAPELIELDDSSDDSDDDSDATEGISQNERGDLDGHIKTETMDEVDTEVNGDATHEAEGEVAGEMESDAEGEAEGDAEGEIEDDAEGEAAGDTEDNPDVTRDAQYSEDVTENEDAEGDDDIEDDPEEVHAAIFDLQTA